MSLAEAIDQLGELAAKIRSSAFTDDKTPLQSALALSQEQRAKSAASDYQVVVFGDLNDFKHINDDYSHEAGDLALRAVGEKIREIVVLNLKAKAFRRSGDEFVLLLEQDSFDQFLSFLSSFERISFSHNERELTTGLSFGYAVADGKVSLDELLQRADAACQMAKHPGAATCVAWSENIDLNPRVRISGWCEACNARITCTLPKKIAPPKPVLCPCCGTAVS